MLRRDVPLDDAISHLRLLDTEGGNIIGKSDPVIAYVEWVDNVEGYLRFLHVNDDRAEKLLSRRYWGLVEKANSPYVYKLLTTEIRVQRQRLLDRVEELLDLQNLRDRPGLLAMPDTNALLHFQRVDRVNYHQVTGERGAIRLIISIHVLDELDEKRYTGSEKIRKSARTALRPLNDRLADLESNGYAALNNDTTVEYLLTGDRVRGQDTDGAILDQAELLQHVTARVVVVITGDLGMRARAVARGLRVVSMPQGHARDMDVARGEEYEA